MDASKCQLYHIFIFCLCSWPVVGVSAVNECCDVMHVTLSMLLFSISNKTLILCHPLRL